MYKRLISIATCIICILFQFSSVYAASGESGYFGGISEGIMLPKTITEHVATKKKKKVKLYYKEMIFITGEPVEVTGNIEIDRDESVVDKSVSGTYKEKYKITATSDDNSVKLNRTVELDTSFIKYNGDYSVQIKKDSTVNKWAETINVKGTEYKVNEDLSDFAKGKNFASFIEDRTPGITYYNGNISYRIVYQVKGETKIEERVEGESYGFEQPWSKAENQKIMCNIEAKGDKGWQMAVEIKPFINSKKTLMYENADPYTISFAGTYTQKFQTEGGMKYKILTNHPNLTKNQKEGSVYISTPNDFEKLRIPSQLSYVSDGHSAKKDIEQLMSMEILDYSPLDFQPYEAISRGDFIKALCKAMNIKPDQNAKKSNKNKITVFADVQLDNPLYDWILEAHKVKLVKGTGQSCFNPQKPIKKEEVYTLLIRVLGLERLGLNPTPVTKFIDDKDISSWAKDSVYAVYRIGLFEKNSGYLYPKNNVSKAEAAVYINRLIDFLRKDMINNYKRL